MQSCLRLRAGDINARWGFRPPPLHFRFSAAAPDRCVPLRQAKPPTGIPRIRLCQAACKSKGHAARQFRPLARIWLRLFVFAFFTPALTGRLLVTGPTPGRESGARSKTAPAAPPLPFRRCHGFCFRWVFMALRAAGPLSPQLVKRAANSRVTDSGFKKKL